MRPFTAISNETSHTIITWIVNNVCPFKCWYCLPQVRDGGVNRAYDWTSCLNFIKLAQQKYQHLHFALSGGEPSVWPYIDNLISYTKEQQGAITCGITSNLVRSTAWWQDYAKFFTYVIASYHPDQIIDTVDRNIWLAKVEELSKHTHVLMRLTMDPLHWDHCISLYQKLKNEPNLSFSVEPVRLINFNINSLDNSWFRYSSEQDQYLQTKCQHIRTKKRLYPFNDFNQFKQKTWLTYEDGTKEQLAHVSDITLHKMNNFNGWSCKIGQDHLFIDPNGWIKPGNCDQGAILGNVKDPDRILWPSQPVICQTNFCHCTTDIRISKFKTY